MRLYDSFSRRVEDLGGTGAVLTLYVCGITPYDTTHLGHAFTYASADVLVRWLEFRGRKVKYVQNVTDIDDDLLRRAKETGEDWRALANRWTAHYIRDMQSLNVRAPDHFPRATEVIPDIIVSVERLLNAGVAYRSGDGVYFDLSRFPEYGQLSKLPREEMLPIANERGNHPDDPHKRHPLDFVLWQGQQPGEPAWDSPWGPGRPGWHIECSTMAGKFLGETIDVHGGGHDLIFPHHESEIAQVASVNGRRPFARHWFHTAMVSHGSEKMSKSLGNLVMVNDLLKRRSADGLRLYLASHHYRRPWTHDEAGLASAERLAGKLGAAASAQSGGNGPMDLGPEPTSFAAAMDDDLDTPAAIQALSQLADRILGGADAGQDIESDQEDLRRLSDVFGLRLGDETADDASIEGWNRHLQRFPEPA